MLFYKAWRESRTAFLWGVLLLLLDCVGAILVRQYGRVQGGGAAYQEYVTAQIFGGTSKMLFIVVVILLGQAGLLRERSHRRAIFTLSLPVRRFQFLGAQLGTGLMEVAVLAALPAVLVQPLSILVHQSYPIAEALRFSFLRFACGTEIFALAFVLSTVVRGTYTAPIACYLALAVQARLANWHGIERYWLNPLRTMDWGRNLQDLSQPFPWFALALFTVAAIFLFGIAAGITERQNI